MALGAVLVFELLLYGFWAGFAFGDSGCLSRNGTVENKMLLYFDFWGGTTLIVGFPVLYFSALSWLINSHQKSTVAGMIAGAVLCVAGIVWSHQLPAPCAPVLGDPAFYLGLGIMALLWICSSLMLVARKQNSN